MTCAWLIVILGVSQVAANPLEWGLSKVDITPEEPLRLSGYADRKTPSGGIEQQLFARALAIRDSDATLTVVVSAETIGFPAALADRVAAEARRRWDIPRSRFVLCSTHSHTAPHIAGYAPNILEVELTEAERAATDRYTDALAGLMVRAAELAIDDLAPGKAFLGGSRMDFAVNRRVIRDGKWAGFGVQPGATVDHCVPILKIVRNDGTLRGIVYGYACHATTLDSSFNRVCGDWPGYASENCERKHPGTVALALIGCAGDANPEPRGKLDFARMHGARLADAVDRALNEATTPVSAPPAAHFGYAGLAPERPDAVELNARLKSGNVHEQRHARTMLEVLSRKGRLPESYPCPIQALRFGDTLTMLFLGGEVVAEYAHRLRDALPGQSVWITAYANDIFGYVASERMRAEGGYEVDYSMIFYNQPGRWESGTEDLVVRRAREITSGSSADGPSKPHEAIRTMQLDDALEIELVASEPTLRDPINMAFGPDGRLWVVEMHDYPGGRDGQGEPGGAIRVLSDRDGDGKYENGALFADGLPYPTGVMPWRGGVLVTAAPDILYLRDTDNDGKADARQVLFTGFDEANPQHRVNGFAYGLDNWVYVAGDRTGEVRSTRTGQVVNMAGRDARIRPDEGWLEPVSGVTQFGRSRDDWGHWFGGANYVPFWYYAIPDRYTRRNPFVATPRPWTSITDETRFGRVYPASRTVERFNDLFTANRFTSACSPTAYRDRLLGPSFHNALLACEPVHNLVHRSVLHWKGTTPRAVRIPAEQDREFLASTDPWFRPTRVLTGPDGAVWVVDMYRQTIEHPDWIPDVWQQRLDLRAGDTMGRIYRVFPRGQRPGPYPRLADLATETLVARLSSTNGWVRDTAQRLLVHRQDREAVELLERLVNTHAKAVTRIHALAALEGLGALSAPLLARAVRDPHPQVRKWAIRFSEPYLINDATLRQALYRAAEDPSGEVRTQAAYSLGTSQDPETARCLGRLAIRSGDDPYLRTAVVSSAMGDPETILSTVLAHGEPSESQRQLVDDLIATAVGKVAGNSDFSDRQDASTSPREDRTRDASDAQRKCLARVLAAFAPELSQPVEAWHLQALAGWFQTAARRELLRDFWVGMEAETEIFDRIVRMLRSGRAWANDGRAEPARRVAGIAVLGRCPDHLAEDLDTLASLLAPRVPQEVSAAALETLARLPYDEVPAILVDGWSSYVPRMRRDVTEILLCRTPWTLALIDGIEQGRIAPAELDASQRERLASHPDSAVRERAERVLALKSHSDRQQVLADFRSSLTLEADRARGAKVFQRVCAACHRFGDVGHALGPDLAALQDRSAHALLTALIDPNRAVEPKFVSYIAAALDGRIYSGMVVSETSNSIIIARPDGRQDELVRAEIDTLIATGKSFMPEGLERDLSPQDVADVIVYIQSESAAVR